jgi:hypothetical protein
MMRGIWDIVVTDRMWDLRGYSPTYAFEIVSHRLARYGSPALHALALAANLLLLRRARIYVFTLLAQLALVLATAGPEPQAAGPLGRPVRLLRYYGLVTASIALGTIDRLRDGPPAAWEKSEGTR